MMKKIMNRRTGKFLATEEAIALCKQLESETDATWDESSQMYAYAAKPEMEAYLRTTCEKYGAEYVFAYADILYIVDGYAVCPKICVIAIKDLPSDFETKFPDFVVIG